MKVKNYLIATFILGFSIAFGQNINNQKQKVDEVLRQKNRKIEGRNGNLITDSILRKVFFDNEKKYLDKIAKHALRTTTNLPAVSLCANGTFEEFETISGVNYLNNFEYTFGEPLNPMQCQLIDNVADTRISQYNPIDSDLMASTVPSNFIDEYIGNINAFDQFTLKINYKESFPSLSLIQSKRFKTNNETVLKFNYKAVLQSVIRNDHDSEQPFFKARVINNAGTIVSEFCLIGSLLDCIFKQAPVLEEGSSVLYTPNWQSGILDISSIPNNEEFTVEFMASRCGLHAHFGYAYVDDICLLHSNESLQGSIELDPMYKICPTLPTSICGSFNLPNSGGINATVSAIELNVRDQSNTIVYTTQTPIILDMTTKRFCFDLVGSNLPNINNGTYNVAVKMDFGIVQTNCSGTTFVSAADDDANPGWDIWFLNCTNCPLTLQPASLKRCDNNQDGKEFFNLTTVQNTVTTPQAGLTFTYFSSLDDAANDTNPIVAITNYESTSSAIFIRVALNSTCYKIIAIPLIVKNPKATISGILNICSGSTILTASSGASYLWSGSLATTQSITVTSIGNYSVTVTDSDGCTSVGTVKILPNGVAPLPSITLSQPTCATSTGSIQVTSPASEISFDNGANWGTNATVSNLPIGNYLVKIRTASGCTSYSSSVNIIAFLSFFPSYSSVDPTSCGELGSITINTPSAFYSFDDGVTWITNNVAINLISGTYLIRTKDVDGCISNFNSVNLNGEFLPKAAYIFDNPYCGNLGSITITSPATQYSFDGGNTWQTSNVLTNLTSGSYLIKIKDSQGCTSTNAYVYLNDLETSYPLYEIIEAGCGTYATLTIKTPADEYSFDGGITWTTNPILPNLNGGSSFQIVVRKGTTCQSYANTVYIYSKFLPIPSTNDYQTSLCDGFNDGSENVDLTVYNSKLIANYVNFNFTYYKTEIGADTADFNDIIPIQTSCNLSNTNNTVYARVVSTDGCYNSSKLQFTFIDSPRINMLDTFPLCEFKNVFVTAGFGFDSYLWSNGKKTQTISITEPGNYWVVVTENHGSLICDSKKDFTIFLSNPATITSIETIDWTINENVIEVFVTGLRTNDYEYSLNGIDYQKNNKFENLKTGVYKVFVKDVNQCGVVSIETVLLNYTKFFTPNGDGINDTWRINFSQLEKKLDVKIFDRYGKFIKQLKSDEAWDGTYNGETLPSDDYWFYVTREDGQIHKGHFSMKR